MKQGKAVGERQEGLGRISCYVCKGFGIERLMLSGSSSSRLRVFQCRRCGWLQRGEVIGRRNKGAPRSDPASDLIFYNGMSPIISNAIQNIVSHWT